MQVGVYPPRGGGVLTLKGLRGCPAVKTPFDLRRKF